MRANGALILAMAAGSAALCPTTAFAQQGGGTPGTGSAPIPTASPALMGRERLDTIDKLDYDREREEVKKKGGPARTADGRELKLTRKEQQAINRVQAALSKKDYVAASTALDSAKSSAESADAKYAVGALQLELGYATKDQALQDQGVEAALASGSAPANVLPQLYRHQGIAALQARDVAKAEAALAKLAELTPQDADAVVLLAEAKNRAKKPAEALPLFEKAVALKKASGQPVPPQWTRAAEVMAAMVRAQGNRQQ